MALSYLRWLVYAATTRVQVAAVWTLSSHHHYSNHSPAKGSLLYIQLRSPPSPSPCWPSLPYRTATSLPVRPPPVSDNQHQNGGCVETTRKNTDWGVVCFRIYLEMFCAHFVMNFSETNWIFSSFSSFLDYLDLLKKKLSQNVVESWWNLSSLSK